MYILSQTLQISLTLSLSNVVLFLEQFNIPNKYMPIVIAEKEKKENKENKSAFFFFAIQ